MPGPQGPQGAPGMKMAIVPHQDDFVALFCVESPDVRFEDVPRVRLGQAVQIRSPAVAEPLVGNVLFVSSLADIQKNTLQVKVEIESPPPMPAACG